MVSVEGCAPFAIDAKRDAELAALGPTRTATGGFYKPYGEGEFSKRDITLKFDWAKNKSSSEIGGSANYHYLQKNVGILAVFESKGSEAIMKGKFSGGHGGKFDGFLVDTEDPDDRNRITGILCADGTGTITRHRSSKTQEWKLRFDPFPLGIEDVLQGSFSFPLTAQSGLNTWNKPIFGQGSIELTVDGAKVSGSVHIEANTMIPFINIVLSGPLQGVHYRDGRLVLSTKLPWQAADMERCLRIASRAEGCVGESTVWIFAQRAGDTFVGRYTALGIGGRWSGAGGVVPLQPEEVAPFDAAVQARLSSLKASGNDPEVVSKSDWSKK